MLLKNSNYKSVFTTNEKCFTIEIIFQNWCNLIFFWTVPKRNDVGYLLNHCLMYVYRAGTSGRRLMESDLHWFNTL